MRGITGGAVKLFYWKEDQNSGDAMNVWLWPRLLPSNLDADDSTLFVGIGRYPTIGCRWRRIKRCSGRAAAMVGGSQRSTTVGRSIAYGVQGQRTPSDYRRRSPLPIRLL